MWKRSKPLLLSFTAALITGTVALAVTAPNAPAHPPGAIVGFNNAQQGPCQVQESGYTLGWPLLVQVHAKDPEAQRLGDLQEGSSVISVGFVIKNNSARTVNPEYTATLRDSNNRILAWVLRSQGSGTPIYYIPPGGSAIVGATTRYSPEVTQSELDSAPGVHLDIELKCPAHSRAFERFFTKKDMSAYEIAEKTGSWANVPAVTRPLQSLPGHASFVGIVQPIACDDGPASGCWNGSYDWNYRVSGNFTNPGGYRKWNGTPMVLFRDKSGRIIGGDAMGTESLRCKAGAQGRNGSSCRDLAVGETTAWEFESGDKELPWNWGSELPTVHGSVQPVWGTAGDALGCPTKKVRPC